MDREGSQFFKQCTLTCLAHPQQHAERMDAGTLLQMVARGASVLGPVDPGAQQQLCPTVRYNVLRLFLIWIGMVHLHVK